MLGSFGVRTCGVRARPTGRARGARSRRLGRATARKGGNGAGCGGAARRVGRLRLTAGHGRSVSGREACRRLAAVVTAISCRPGGPVLQPVSWSVTVGAVGLTIAGGRWTRAWSSGDHHLVVEDGEPRDGRRAAQRVQPARDVGVRIVGVRQWVVMGKVGVVVG